jgi:hypothetical protein
MLGYEDQFCEPAEHFRNINVDREDVIVSMPSRKSPKLECVRLDEYFCCDRVHKGHWFEKEVIVAANDSNLKLARADASS